MNLDSDQIQLVTAREIDRYEANMGVARPLYILYPEETNSFDLYQAESGRFRKIPNFIDVLREQLKEDERAIFQATSLFHRINEEFGSTIDEIAARMKYLGLNKNTLVNGDNSTFVLRIIKSVDFGRQTTEDKGRITTSPKNYIKTGSEPALNPLYTPVTSNELIPPIQDNRLLELIKNLTDSQIVEAMASDYPLLASDNNKIVTWIVEQAISRRLLPREPQVEQRQIDLDNLTFVKYLGLDPESDPGFQASNPVSVWVDTETNRKFIVKECPEPTLQSDYFGLEMLQLSGVPIYEFYFSERNGKRVLVSGFLEGFQDPSKLVSLPEGAPKEMIKTMLPDSLKDSRYIQRAMLVEILIGEYNSKAHNFMVLGNSVQHLDQGGSLTSTASGKFKGFGETVSVQDIEDVLHCYSDWDANLEQPTNEAYAAVAIVKDHKLVITNKQVAQSLLYSLRQIPPELIDQALENAGYEDGPRSIDRMQSWIKRIDEELLPQYETREPSNRKDQYIRWLNEAKTTFLKAIIMGGELSYYKSAIRSRRSSLEQTWLEAINSTS